MELLSDEGFRIDGRRADDIRGLVCRLGVFSQADGSSFLEIGNTKILAAVYGPHEVQKQTTVKKYADRAAINVQFSQAVFSTSIRKQRPRGDYKSLEVTAIVREIFEAAVLCETYPNSQIDIFLEVLQADGSVLAACINAATAALVHAGIALKDLVVASTSGLIMSDKPIMDINYTEEGVNCPVFTLAMLAKSKEILSLESVGRISLDKMAVVQETAIEACSKVYKELRQALLEQLSK